MTGGAEGFVQTDPGGGVAVVAVDVAQQPSRRSADADWAPSPNFSTLSRARARRSFKAQPALATPITGTSRRPCRTIASSAGKIFL